MADSRKEKARGKAGISRVVGGQPKTAFQNDRQANNTPIPIPAANAKQAKAEAKAKRSRSTSTETQILKLLAFLREGPKTTHFLRTHGISHPGGRILDLRRRGYEILTQLVDTVDAHGFPHINVAQYVLLKEPPQQMSRDDLGAA